MSLEDHRHFREMLGAFLLDDLDERERAAVQAHVDGCPVCQEEIDELRPVVEALAEASPDHLTGGHRPPTDLEQKILARVSEDRQARRHVRFRRSVLAAAAVLVFAAGLVVIPGLLAPEVPLEPVSFSTVAPGVDAEANLVAHTWGTETKLVVSGLESGRIYRVTLLGQGGDRVPSGSLIGTGERPIECSLNAALEREGAASLEVRAADGDLVLGADLSDAS